MTQDIFLHGLGQKPESWRETIACLDRPGPAACPDLAGFADKGAVTFERLYQGFADYTMSAEGPLNLCGLSLGAIIALRYAIERPERVQSLILIGGRDEMPRGLLRLQNVLFRLLPERCFEQMGFAKGEISQLTNSMLKLGFSAGLPGVACPALVIRGEKDSANKKAAENLARGLANAEALVIEGAGHEVNVDAPRSLGAAIRGFYGKWRL